MIRLSRNSDLKEITELLKTSFGKVEQAYLNIENRYLLYIEDNKIVAMTGLTSATNYKGLEIDWTCTHPDYRNKGYMHKLFERLIQLTDEDIYCSCWRLSNKEKANLHNLMVDFNFKCINKSEKEWNNDICRAEIYGLNCIYYKENKNCHCYEDLYLLKR